MEGSEPGSGSGPRLAKLLPVELKRLVFSYLGQTNCLKTRNAFVEEDAELKELSALVDKKLLRTLDFDLFGHNLEDVVKEYIL